MRVLRTGVSSPSANSRAPSAQSVRARHCRVVCNAVQVARDAVDIDATVTAAGFPRPIDEQIASFTTPKLAGPAALTTSAIARATNKTVEQVSLFCISRARYSRILKCLSSRGILQDTTITWNS